MDRRRTAWSVVLAVGLSVIYFGSMARVLMFLADRPSLNSSARGAMLLVEVIPAVLYLAVVTQWAVYRRRTGSLLPVSGAALFGTTLCLVFVA